MLRRLPHGDRVRRMRSVFVDEAAPALSGDAPAALFDLFLASRRDFGHRPALWVDGCSLTYSELDNAARRLAAVVRAVRGKDAPANRLQCGLLVNRTPTAYAAVLASLMVGSAYAPLNTRFPSARLREIIAASAIDTIIADHRSAAAIRPLLENSPRPLTVLLPDSEAAPGLGPLRARHRIITRSEIEATAPDSTTARVAPEDGAYLLFTSGSTGTPKGVLVSHSNALAYIANVHDRYRPRPDDRFSQLFDFSFDLSVHDMFLAWSAGGCLCCAPEGSLAALGGYINKCGLTFWFSVPSAAAYMRQLHMLAPRSYPDLRWSLFCGEALPVGLARAWQEAAPNSVVENLYGPTETTVALTAYRMPRENVAQLSRLQTVPIGVPLPGQRVMVVDEIGRSVEDGSAGELYLGGSQVAPGYWHAPAETAARFRRPECLAGRAEDRWYRTGDRAVMTREHGLVFLGRIDRQVKINGHRVELLEVESAVRRVAETDMVAAFAWPVGEGGLTSSIACFVSQAVKSASDIVSRCREQLPAYMVPDRIFAIADWPLNSSGKTDYKLLATLLENSNARVRK
jgi:amino acid adenylation domain-containing protein